MEIKEFIKLAKKNKIDPIQIVTTNMKNIDINVLNDSLRKSYIETIISYSITAHYNNKDVKVNANYLEEDIIDEIKLKAELLESDYEEKYIEESKTLNDKADEVSFDLSKEKEIILKTHKEKDKYPKTKDMETDYYISKKQLTINNSYGLNISTAKNIYSLVTRSITKEKDNISDIWEVNFSTKKDFDIEKRIKDTLIKSNEMLEKEDIKSKKYDVILSSIFMSNLLKEFIPALSKEYIRKQNSYLESKLNKKIFGDNITIIEDPNNKDLPGYTSFDNEGVETYKKTIIDKGVLKTYLYNNKEAILDKKKSTGNGYGDISAKNMYIKPGKKTEEELIKNIKDGLYIWRYQNTGAVVINQSTGAISVQIKGQIIKNGKKTKSFESSILTTDIYELLSNVKEIGNNLEFNTMTTGAPSLYVKDMSISSK